MKAWTRLAAICVAGAWMAVAAADATVMIGPAGCRFAVPGGWSPRDIRWTGSCQHGLAEGRGVLREFVDGKVARLFFGSLQAGQPALGVIEQADGFIAGRFEAGQAVRDGDRNTLIQAFDEASAAAGQVAEAYRAAGNLGSARFYSDKARQLAQQMD